MRLQDLIEELIGLVNLIHLTCASNNDLGGRERANCDPLTLAITISETLSCTRQLTNTDPRSQRISFLIVIILLIDTLVNCALMTAKQVIHVTQDLM